VEAATGLGSCRLSADSQFRRGGKGEFAIWKVASPTQDNKPSPPLVYNNLLGMGACHTYLPRMYEEVVGSERLRERQQDQSVSVYTAFAKFHSRIVPFCITNILC
jgi:hypothetical protein